MFYLYGGRNLMSTIETNTKTAAANEKKDKLVLELDTPVQFESLIQTAYYTTCSFCDEFINPLFHNVFSDFYGSKIEIANNRSLITVLAFYENNIDDTRVKGIERTIANGSNDVDSRIKLINNTLASDRYHNQYKLTQDCKDLLESIIPGAARQQNGKIRWNDISGENCISNNFNFVSGNQSQVIIQVQIDINKLLRVIFGAKNADDSFQYMAVLGNPINPVSGFGGQLIVKNWQLFVMKLSNKAVNEVTKSYGVSGQNNLGFIC